LHNSQPIKLRDNNNKIFEHLFGGYPNGIFLGVSSRCRSKTFF
jgi:hypothetical protein